MYVIIKSKYLINIYIYVYVYNRMILKYTILRKK